VATTINRNGRSAIAVASGRDDTSAEGCTMTASIAQHQARIDRAFAKALEQARVGNLPTAITARAWSNGVTRWRYSVASRTTGGDVWLVDLTDTHGTLTTACDCPATGVCWHRAAARLAHTGTLTPHRTANRVQSSAMAAD
jgi:hypothetical protein